MYKNVHEIFAPFWFPPSRKKYYQPRELPGPAPGFVRFRTTGPRLRGTTKMMLEDALGYVSNLLNKQMIWHMPTVVLVIDAKERKIFLCL